MTDQSTYPEIQHIYPVNQKDKHILIGSNCPCEPEIVSYSKENLIQIVHNYIQ